MCVGLLSPNLRSLVLPTVSLCDTEKVTVVSTCIIPTKKHGGGVMMWECFAGDTVGDLSKLKAY